MKVGANQAEQQTIKQLAADGRKKDYISKLLEIDEKVVANFMKGGEKTEPTEPKEPPAKKGL